MTKTLEAALDAVSKIGKPRHTPGPWEIVAPALQKTGARIGGKNGEFICDISRHDGNKFWYHEWDARIIAAAPDLLAALENARNVLAAIATGDLATIERDSPALAQCRAAIAKAKGD